MALDRAKLATANAGLVTDIIVCPGLDYCALATARSIPVAQRISERFGEGARADQIGDLKIKISGCINACGHHHVGHIGILGLDRKGRRNLPDHAGVAQATSGPRSATSPVRVSRPEDVVDAVETVVDTYLGLRTGAEEDFLAAYRRVGMAPFKKALYERNVGEGI